MDLGTKDLLDSEVVQRSFEVLENGATLQFVVNGIPYEAKKVDGKVEYSQRKPERPFLIFEATSGAVEPLSRASSPREFGRSFAEQYLGKNVDIKIMAPPGTALTYGIFSMLRRMGIRQNMIGGEVKK